MFPELECEEVVLFDVPAEHVDELWVALQKTRLVWLHATDDHLFLVAALRAEPADLARLLRDAERWLADSGLPYLRFSLDGREYELRAQAEALAAKAA